MDEAPTKFLLPSPDFGKKDKEPKSLPHYLTPSGMTLLPREKQPPPMYGKRGATTPSKFIENKEQEEKPQERFFCEPCDMEFQSSNDIRRHRQQHERCPVEGCKFKGQSSVMDKHVMEIHNSGIFEKIKKVSTPEEIAAWREERRKKYPTLANTQLRQLAQEQRQKRGERLGENKSRFGRHEDRKRARNVEKKCDQQEGAKRQNPLDRRKRCREQNRRNKKTNQQLGEKKDSKPSLPSKNVEEKECGNEAENIGDCDGVGMFKGTSQMENYEHYKPKKLPIENALSSLVGMYGSDEDDSDIEMGKDESGNAEIINEKLEQNCKDTEKQDLPIVEEVKIVPTEEGETTESSPAEEISLSLNSNTEPKSNVTNVATTTITTSSSDAILNNSETVIDAEIEIDAECKSNGSSDEGPEEVPIEHSDSALPAISKSLPTTNPETVPVKQNNQKKIQAQKRKYGLDYRKIKLRKQNTMLEKLLEPEIRHERNVLLQCVRFVCQNNFFGIGSKNTDEKST